MLTENEAPSPAERRYARTRQEILAAAHTLLKTKGIEGLTMRALADAMDYTPAALYKYFQDKEDILEALRQEGWALFRKMEAETARASLAPLDLFKASGRAYQDFASRYPEYYLLMFTSQKESARSLAEITNQPDFKRGTDFVQAAIDEGYLNLPPGVSALQVRFLVWFISHGMAMLKLTLLRECQSEFDAVGRETIDAFIALISQPDKGEDLR